MPDKSAEFEEERPGPPYRMSAPDPRAFLANAVSEKVALVEFQHGDFGLILRL